MRYRHYNRASRDARDELYRDAGKVIEVGPYRVRLGVCNGWRSYTLLAPDGETTVRVWGSHPGVADCRDAVLTGIRTGKLDPEACMPLLQASPPRYEHAFFNADSSVHKP